MLYKRKDKGLYLKEDKLVEAIQYDGTNQVEIEAFIGQELPTEIDFRKVNEFPELEDKGILLFDSDNEGFNRFIDINKGDYVIKNSKDYIDICDKETFKNLYEYNWFENENYIENLIKPFASSLRNRILGEWIDDDN